MKTSITKIDNNSIYCGNFFKDLSNSNSKTASSLLNRFSGEYFSASLLKSFLTNPAGCLYSYLCKDEATSATSIGSTFHKIMELFYNSEDRTIENLRKIYKEECEQEQLEPVGQYIKGYLDTADYLTHSKKDILNIKCDCEVKDKKEIFVPKFGITIPKLSYVVDRIDTRPEGTFIVDYKTGYCTNKNTTFDGNLGQMILYKWAIEQQYDTEVKDVFLCSPKFSKYYKCDCGEENQLQMIETITRFFSLLKVHNATMVYPYTDKGYFTNTQMKEFREIMNDDSLYNYEIEVEIDED